LLSIVMDSMLTSKSTTENGYTTLPTLTESGQMPHIFSGNETPDVKNEAKLCFVYGELPVNGAVSANDDGFELKLTITLGNIPYSVESSEERKTLLDITYRLGRATDDMVIIDPHQIITVQNSCTLSEKLSAVTLVSAIIRLLTEMRPALLVLSDYMPGLSEILGLQDKNEADTEAAFTETDPASETS
jgi:hypothetical protein